jgi:hypothetical protein
MLLTLPRKHAGLQIEKTAHSVVVTDPGRDYVHVLNARAASILEQCDGAHTCDQIAQVVSHQTHVPYERVAAEVAHLVAAFADLALVESAL